MANTTTPGEQRLKTDTLGRMKTPAERRESLLAADGVGFPHEGGNHRDVLIAREQFADVIKELRATRFVIGSGFCLAQGAMTAR